MTYNITFKLIMQSYNINRDGDHWTTALNSDRWKFNVLNFTDELVEFFLSSYHVY